MQPPKRGVGYCLNAMCDDYAKGVFLLNFDTVFCCPECRATGLIVCETGCTPNEIDGALYREVRVEYNYDCTRRIYRDVAIIQDTSIWEEANVYQLQSPLVRTEKRALKIAESILSNLQMVRTISAGEIPNSNEIVVSFDNSKEQFAASMTELGNRLQNSSLTNPGRKHG